jgi:hypothetical protein
MVPMTAILFILLAFHSSYRAAFFDFSSLTTHFPTAYRMRRLSASMAHIAFLYGNDDTEFSKTNGAGARRIATVAVIGFMLVRPALRFF